MPVVKIYQDMLKSKEICGLPKAQDKHDDKIIVITGIIYLTPI